MRLKRARIDRLALSARLLEGWEALGVRRGPPANALRLIEGEIAILMTLRAHAPTEVDELISRYRRLADACRLELN